MPVRVIVTAGTVADCKAASELITGFEPEALLADRAYDTDDLHGQLIELEADMVISPKSNRRHQRSFDKALYRHRHLIENAFNQLKEWRGIATRYAKRADSFKAAVQIRCLFLWLKIL